MGRPTAFHLTEAQHRALTRAASDRAADPKFRDRCRAVAMYGTGTSRAATAKAFTVDLATLGRWVVRYRKLGILGLQTPEDDGRGRPPQLLPEHLAWLKTVAQSRPSDHGFAFSTWTLPRLATFLEKTHGVTVKSHYIGHLLRKMGFVRKRPKHVLEGKRDEALHDEAKGEIQTLKAGLATDDRVIISQDEAEFHLFPYLVVVWCLVTALQPKVPTPGKNQKRVLYGGLNLQTGRLTPYWASSKSGGHFIEFLKVLLEDYSDRRILMILDNGSFHHTKAVNAFLAEHKERLEVKWLPPYCPDLNDIERTWRRLKASHASNFLYNSLDELVANVDRGIEELNAAARQ